MYNKKPLLKRGTIVTCGSIYYSYGRNLPIEPSARGLLLVDLYLEEEDWDAQVFFWGYGRLTINKYCLIEFLEEKKKCEN